MRVHDYNVPGTSTAATTRTSESCGTEPASQLPSDVSRDGDRVELSGTLWDLTRALSSYGEERFAAVQSLTSEYQAQRYQVDTVATGRAIVAEALCAESREAD